MPKVEVVLEDRYGVKGKTYDQLVKRRDAIMAIVEKRDKGAMSYKTAQKLVVSKSTEDLEAEFYAIQEEIDVRDALKNQAETTLSVKTFAMAQ